MSSSCLNIVLLLATLWVFAQPTHAAAAEPKPIAGLKVAFCFSPGKKEFTDYAKYLEATFQVKCSLVEANKSQPKQGSEEKPESPFSGLEALEDCDVIVSNLYRTWAPPEQLAKLQQHFKSKPVVGLRKAHHGFQNWLEADQEVFGVTYRGHYGINKGMVEAVEAQKDNPLLVGWKPHLPGGGLYGLKDMQPDVTPLIVGWLEGQAKVPQMWQRVNKQTGQRVIYMRYDNKDLAQYPEIRDLLTRSIAWAAGRELEPLKK